MLVQLSFECRTTKPPEPFQVPGASVGSTSGEWLPHEAPGAGIDDLLLRTRLRPAHAHDRSFALCAMHRIGGGWLSEHGETSMGVRTGVGQEEEEEGERESNPGEP